MVNQVIRKTERTEAGQPKMGEGGGTSAALQTENAVYRKPKEILEDTWTLLSCQLPVTFPLLLIMCRLNVWIVNSRLKHWVSSSIDVFIQVSLVLKVCDILMQRENN